MAADVNKFEWVSGYLQESWYNGWHPGEPSNDSGGNNDCGLISNAGLWNDARCSSVLPYICTNKRTCELPTATLITDPLFVPPFVTLVTDKISASPTDKSHIGSHTIIIKVTLGTMIKNISFVLTVPDPCPTATIDHTPLPTTVYTLGENELTTTIP
jgi:hypothetical protein